MNNPCVRCGKQRIVAGEWSETITTSSGTSVVKYTKTVCPDPECQKIVDRQQAAARAKSDEIQRNFEARAAQRKSDRVQLNLARKKKT